MCSVAQLCLTLCDPMDCNPPGPSVHGDSPGKNTGIGCHALLQGIFPTQGSNLGLPHYRWIFPSEPSGKPKNTGVGSLSLLQGTFPSQELIQGLQLCRQILYQLRHQGSPRILEWVAYPFSSRSSQLRNQTRVSCIAEGQSKCKFAKVDILPSILFKR